MRFDRALANVCWEAKYSTPSRNDATGFDARSD
jgi:hypothetical protein